MKESYSRRRFINETGITLAGAGTIMVLPGGDMTGEASAAQMSMMSGSEIDAVKFGKSLRGLGINLLVTDVEKTVAFSKSVLLAEVVFADEGFAILKRADIVWMLHADHTYNDNPLLGFVKDVEGRGQGIELRLYELDPDGAEARAAEDGYTILSGSLNKPHGLRECYILDPDGYCWVPSRPLESGEE